MPPYLPIPQDPGKMPLEAESERSRSRSRSRSPSPAGFSDVDTMLDGDVAKHRHKAAPSLHSRHLQLPDGLHRISIDSLSDVHGPPSPALPGLEPFSNPSPSLPSAPSRLPPGLRRFWFNHRPVVYVFLAQLFGALMNLCARLLELDAVHPMHPFQLLFARMSVTVTVSSLYMYWTGVPHFPLGPPAVRWHLVARGLTGFCGIFSMWYSMMYLPLAEATVITFLSPSVSGYICHVLLHDPFTRREQIASGIALVGVILIARPFSFLRGGHAAPSPEALGDVLSGNVTDVDVEVLLANVTEIASSAFAAATNLTAALANSTAPPLSGPVALHSSTMQRLVAVAVALFGVLGSSCAFTAIRAIGTRAHPLISVNYFSGAGTVVSATVLVLGPIVGFGQPALHFGLPHSGWQWFLLLCTCVCGFMTQLCITKGLGLERSNRASAMMYTNMLFAAGFDRFVFGNQMGLISLAGCGLIIGSALWVVLAKKPRPETGAGHTDIEIGLVDRGERGENSESVPMLADEGNGQEDEASLDPTESRL